MLCSWIRIAGLGAFFSVASCAPAEKSAKTPANAPAGEPSGGEASKRVDPESPVGNLDAALLVFKSIQAEMVAIALDSSSGAAAAAGQDAEAVALSLLGAEQWRRKPPPEMGDDPGMSEDADMPTGAGSPTYRKPPLTVARDASEPEEAAVAEGTTPQALRRVKPDFGEANSGGGACAALTGGGCADSRSRTSDLRGQIGPYGCVPAAVRAYQQLNATGGAMDLSDVQRFMRSDGVFSHSGGVRMADIPRAGRAVGISNFSELSDEQAAEVRRQGGAVIGVEGFPGVQQGPGNHARVYWNSPDGPRQWDPAGGGPNSSRSGFVGQVGRSREDDNANPFQWYGVRPTTMGGGATGGGAPAGP